jgi:hypothetical protein
VVLLALVSRSWSALYRGVIALEDFDQNDGTVVGGRGEDLALADEGDDDGLGHGTVNGLNTENDGVEPKFSLQLSILP